MTTTSGVRSLGANDLLRSFVGGAAATVRGAAREPVERLFAAP